MKKNIIIGVLSVLLVFFIGINIGLASGNGNSSNIFTKGKYSKYAGKWRQAGIDDEILIKPDGTVMIGMSKSETGEFNRLAVGKIKDNKMVLDKVYVSTYDMEYTEDYSKYIKYPSYDSDLSEFPTNDQVYVYKFEFETEDVLKIKTEGNKYWSNFKRVE